MMNKKMRGFTIVELLIVIVVIAILAAVSVVAYNGISQRARDTQRKNDIAAITKGLELYYIDKGKYPTITTTPVTMNSSWATTNDTSWSKLEEALVPEYMSSVPKDPTPGDTSPHGAGVLGYAYFADKTGYYCGVGESQVYILVYALESGERKNDLIGDCTGNSLGPYQNSNYRVVKR